MSLLLHQWEATQMPAPVQRSSKPQLVTRFLLKFCFIVLPVWLGTGFLVFRSEWYWHLNEFPQGLVSLIVVFVPFLLAIKFVVGKDWIALLDWNSENEASATEPLTCPL